MSCSGKKVMLVVGIVIAMMVASIPLTVSEENRVYGDDDSIEVTKEKELIDALSGDKTKIIVIGDITLHGEHTLKENATLEISLGNTLTLAGTLTIDGKLDLIGDMEITASDIWKSIGPYSSYVDSLMVDGSNLYAGTDDGIVYKSTGGGDWESFGSNLRYPVRALVVDGDHNVYAGTDDGIVYKIGTDGSTWTSFDGGSGPLIRALVVDGDHNVYAGTNDGMVYKSTDGSTWTSFGNDIGGIPINSLVVDGNNLYAGTYGGVYKISTDGSTWTSLDGGKGPYIRALVVDGNNLYAGTDDGVCKISTDGGNWTSFGNGIGNLNVRTLVVDGNNLYAGTLGGVYKISTDGGDWGSFGSGLGSPIVLALVVDGDYAYAGTNGGVYKTSDGTLSIGSMDDISFNGGSLSFSKMGEFIVNGETEIGSNGGISIEHGKMTLYSADGDHEFVIILSEENGKATVYNDSLVKNGHISVGDGSTLVFDNDEPIIVDSINLQSSGRIITDSSPITAYSFLNYGDDDTDDGVEGKANSVVVLWFYKGATDGVEEVVQKIIIHTEGGLVSDGSWFKEGYIYFSLVKPVGEGESPELPTPRKEGYSFKEWEQVPAKESSVFHEYRAVYSKSASSQFTITLDTKGGIILDPTWTSNGNGVYIKTFANGSELMLPTATKQYHEFDKWSPSPSSTVTRNAEYEASWSTVTFKVTLDTKGGSISDPFWLPAGNGKYVRYVEAGSSITLPTASKDGTDFQGWTASSSSITVVSDLYLTAQWGSGTTATTFDPVIVYVIVAIAIIGMVIITVVSIGKGR